jgi:hypothetical protein
VLVAMGRPDDQESPKHRQQKGQEQLEHGGECTQVNEPSLEASGR